MRILWTFCLLVDTILWRTKRWTSKTRTLRAIMLSCGRRRSQRSHLWTGAIELTWHRRVAMQAEPEAMERAACCGFRRKRRKSPRQWPAEEIFMSSQRDLILALGLPCSNTKAERSPSEVPDASLAILSHLEIHDQSSKHHEPHV